MSHSRILPKAGSKSPKSICLSDCSTWIALGLPVQSEPVPIKDAVSRIAILLNLEDDIACIDRMESAAWDKNKTVLSGSESDEEDQRQRSARES